MKTVKSFAYFMAVAMVSTVGMVSCKDKNAPEEEKGRSQGQYVETVNAEFALAMPAQLGPNRMPGTTVQLTNSQFQGMTGITLIPFAKADEIGGADSRLGTANITLGDVNTGEIESKTNRAKVYSNVNIPLTTSSFLFYAKSKASGDKFDVGSLTPSNLNGLNVSQPNSIQFDLEPIMGTPSSTYTAGHTALINYLTAVANAEAGAPAVKWCDVTSSADPGMALIFTTFSTIHGLSSFEVSRVLTDLYRSLKPLEGSNALAAAVMDAILAPTDVTPSTTDSIELAGDLAGFPENCNLPSGAVEIAWDGTEKKFKDADPSAMTALASYVYPAQLWYYVNSVISTSNQSQANAYTSTTNTWGDILGLHLSGASVNTRTRAVAIVDPIQYAVARFDVGVKTVAATLEDNSDHIQATPTAVTVPTGGFPITGILIGGQKPVKFDFTPTGSNEYTIYDKNMSYATMAATASDMLAAHYNHTLVLETAAGTTVQIAVEMVNNTGKDFYGLGNMLIPNGGKFYVVAHLNPATGIQGGTSVTGNKVFKQDYTTTATLTLKDLKTAYNTIPDLRTPKLELGFSVNLEWRTGDTYDVPLGI